MRLSRLLLVPVVVLGLGLACLALGSGSASAQIAGAPPGGGLCVNGSYPTVYGCTSGSVPGYAYASGAFSFGVPAYAAAGFPYAGYSVGSPFYGYPCFTAGYVC